MGREGERGRATDRGQAFIRRLMAQSEGADISHRETY